ncbi:thiolase family protein [Acholeplasma hippikon]|uniref:acetyl-CoA C-acetyltransferase n=1 Tax=Acholeplasma hippikon TaxID=264636 RepID=A0A449BIF8_9MOLU|nr:thiolase family protein [Acholeplasma hippikon]VEU82235.1 Acetyl-CoA acetyltransferase [Acholeplasma hippikon]
MKKVFVVAAKRSAIGSYLGTLSNISMVDFSAQILSQMLDNINIDKKVIDEVIIGNVIQSNHGQGIARQISMKAGIPENVAAYSINMLCGSGMKSVISAFQSIQSGDNNLVIAGGVESMSEAPFYITGHTRKGMKQGNQEIIDSIYKDGLIDPFNHVLMGYTAEMIAEKLNISREEQDQYAYKSQMKAIHASDTGFFNKEILPITIKDRKNIHIFDKDEFINRNSNLEKMRTLRTIFKENGTVTAATSSGLNDGASFILLASEEMVTSLNLKPIAEVIATSKAALDPMYMGLGPTLAINKILEKTKMSLAEIDLIEINEAFAAQVLGVVKELSVSNGIDIESILNKLNIHGGAIALGHPLGASGNRILVSLIHELHEYNKTYGLASLCIGGGMGTAVLIKRI